MRGKKEIKEKRKTKQEQKNLAKGSGRKKYEICSDKRGSKYPRCFQTKIQLLI
jgi:hypothetical protein